MKYRDNKQFGTGEYYHIFNRGNGKQDIFLDEQDFGFFLNRLRQNLFPREGDSSRLVQLPRGSFSLISYCLMPNHFHFLIKQNTEIPTSKLLTKLCTGYSIYFNKKYARSGHLFQDQFKQVKIDTNEYLVWLSAYIHQNPKVAGLVENLEKWKWSSYPSFTESKDDHLCDREVILDQFKDKDGYQSFVLNNFEIMKRRKEAQHLLLDFEKRNNLVDLQGSPLSVFSS